MALTKYRYLLIIVSISLALIVVNCIRSIDFEVPGSIQNAIVIQAKVVKWNPSVVSVEVSKTFDFAGQSSTVFISNVILKNITLGQGITIPKIDLGTRGALILEGGPEMSINFIDVYRIAVTTVTGDVFVSTPERLYDVPIADSLTYDLIELESETLLGLKNFSDVIQYKVKCKNVELRE